MAGEAKEPKPYKGHARARILGFLRGGNTRKAACGGAGIGVTTLWQWMKDDAGFKSNVLEAEAASQQEIEDLLLECALKAKDDPKYQTSLIFYSKARLGFRDHGIDPNVMIEDDGSNQFTYETVDGEVEEVEA